LVIKVSTARAEHLARGPAMAARQPQLVLARVNPRSMHKTIGGEAGEAHGFKVRRAARRKPDGASEGASSPSDDKGRGAFDLTPFP
jgi:hypothetical protein